MHKVDTGKDNSIIVFFLEHVMGVILFGMLFVIFLQVFFRYVLNSSLSWTEEIARYLQVYLTFIGAALALKKHVHISLGDAMSKRLPISMRIVISILINVSIGVFLFVVLFHGYQILKVVQYQSSASLGIPMAYVYAVIPISAALSIVFVLADIIGNRGGSK